MGHYFLDTQYLIIVPCWTGTPREINGAFVFRECTKLSGYADNEYANICLLILYILKHQEQQERKARTSGKKEFSPFLP